MQQRIGNSSTDKWHWYGKAFTSTILPTQTLPLSGKDKKWKEQTMDALEREGIKQYRRKLKYRDFYRMIEGKMSYTELSDAIPQLRELEDMMDLANLDTKLKHYDVLGIIVNALIGEYMSTTDKFRVVNIDEISSNEFLRTKKDFLIRYVQEKIEKEVMARMMQMGINPFHEDIDFSSEEEQQAYIQQIQELQEEMTPPEIQEYMTTTWQTVAAKWGNGTLSSDNERFSMDEMDRDMLLDYFLTGECYRFYTVGYDYYKPEYKPSLNVFHSQEDNERYPQDREFVGSIDFLTASQVVQKHGHMITHKEKEILFGKSKTSTTSNLPRFGTQESSKMETVRVPHKGYLDHKLLLGVQDTLGIPMGEYTYLDKEGTERTSNTFLTDYNNSNSDNSIATLASFAREGLSPRHDIYLATDVYFRSYREVGLISFIDENGELQQELVTDDILKEVLKEYGIKNLRQTTLQEAITNPKPNTIVWDYIPETWRGVKITGGYLDKPLYLNVAPTDFQIKGDSNIYDVKLPVSGLIDTPISNKIQPFQVAHNIFMNQAMNLAEKEIGVFFLFDFQYLPSEFKNFGDTEETLLNLHSIVKDVSLFPVDTSKQNLQGGGQFNQFSMQDLSFGKQISEKLQIAERYKVLAFEQVGFNYQRLGAPTAYTTAEGIKTSQEAQFAQTAIYFDKFYQQKKKGLEVHLAVAQYCQGDGKDLSIFHAKSDVSQVYIEHQRMTDPNFPLRRLGLMAVGSPKHNRNLDVFKSYILNNNTLGSDEFAVAKVIASDTFSEIVEIARGERMNRERQAQAEQQAEQESIAMQAQVMEEKDQKEWERQEVSKQRDRENRITVQRIDSLGRALDNNATPEQAAEINRAADLALRQEKQDAEITTQDKELLMKEERLAMEKEEHTALNEERARKFKLEVDKLKLQRDKMKNDKYIAEINKN